MPIATGSTILASDLKGNPAPFYSIEETVGTTHSLTTVANQKVLVIVKGDFTGSSNQQTISLKYDGVDKDTVEVRHSSASNGFLPFTLMYTEVPGAATKNITVTVSVGTIARVRITVQKLLIG